MGFLKWLLGINESTKKSQPVTFLKHKPIPNNKSVHSPVYEAERDSRLHKNDVPEVVSEPRIDSGALERGLTEIRRRVAAEEERERLAREAAEKARAEREAEEQAEPARDACVMFRRTDVSVESRHMTSAPDVRFSISSDGKRRTTSPGGHYSLTSNSYNAVAATVDQQKSFGRMLMRYVNEYCGGKASSCYQRAGISRQLYSRIISDLTKNVSKRTAMQLCIGLKLDRQQSNLFLSYAGYAFSPSSFEDMVFAWCLEKGVYSMFDVNYLLVHGGIEPITIN